MLASKEAVHAKCLEAIEEERQIMPKIDKLVANTRVLQRQASCLITSIKEPLVDDTRKPMHTFLIHTEEKGRAM